MFIEFLQMIYFPVFRFGADIGTLNVIIQSSAQNLTIFSRNGVQGNSWLLGRVEYQSTLPYQVIYEGIGK